MPTLNLPVALRVKGRCLDMGHATDPDKFLEIPGNKLGSIVGDNPGFGPWVLLLGSLQNQLHLLVAFKKLPDMAMMVPS
jgi:hypothetical protein